MNRIVIIILVLAISIFGLILVMNKKTKSVVSVNPYAITLKQINENIKSGSLLIDVRTAEEFQKDRAVGAINLPLTDIEKGVLPNVSKDEIIYLYCHSGRRATQAKLILEKAGYKNVINIKSLFKWVTLGGKNTGLAPTCSAENEAGC